eukprot:362084-Chlamydomonas_euryale.AAC.2
MGRLFTVICGDGVGRQVWRKKMAFEVGTGGWCTRLSTVICGDGVGRQCWHKKMAFEVGT